MNLIHIGYYKNSAILQSNDGVYSFRNKQVDTMSAHACRFAILKPNTTYTVEKLDATSTNVFIVGTSSIDFRKHTPVGDIDNENCKWNIIEQYDDNLPHTFTTSDDDIYCYMYYTSSSEYTARVMLNEGDVLEAYSEPIIVSDCYNHSYYSQYVSSRNETLYSQGIYIGEDGYPHLIGIKETTPPKVLSNQVPRINPITSDYPFLDIPARPMQTGPTLTSKIASAPTVNSKYNDGFVTFVDLHEKMLPLGAFANTEHMDAILIPNQCSEVAKHAFTNSSLKRIYMSKNTKCIKDNLPSGCVVKYYDEVKEENEA